MTGRRIRLTIAFDGSVYAGWQRQRAVTTIQGVLEEKIAALAGERVNLHGAGRTDAGVHALAMEAHFDITCNVPCRAFRYGLNSMLPPDIRIQRAHEVDFNFHARRSAVGKCYFYQFCRDEFLLPTDRLYWVGIKKSFDSKQMEKCLPFIIGIHDFSSFEAVGSRDPQRPGRGAVRRVFSAGFEDKGGGKYRFIICGDGFLRHMVRNIVGTLLEVGQCRLTPDDFRDIVAARNRSTAGPTAPAHGLFLEKIFYNSKTGLKNGLTNN